MKFARRHKAAVTAVASIVLLAAATGLLAYVSEKRDQAELTGLLQEGVRLMDEDEVAAYREAAAVFHEVLDREPLHFRALGNLAIVNKELYNRMAAPDPALLEEADDYCTLALNQRPDHHLLWNTKGVILKMLGRYDDAVVAFQRAVQLEDSVEAYNNLAIVQVLDGDRAAAIETLQTAAGITGRDRPCDVVTWRTMGTLLMLEDPEAGLDTLNQANACNKKDEWTYVLRARLLAKRESHDDTVMALDDAKQAYRSWEDGQPPAQFLRTLGMAYAANEQWQDALEHADGAQEAGDWATPNLFIAAIALAHLGHHDQAMDAYEQAVASWPDILLPDAVSAVAPKGVLWIECTDDLVHWQREAEAALGIESPALLTEPH